MGAARERDQADFDLDRFIDMFDEAVSSRDPRVVDALRSLMMMVILTKPESRDSGLHDRNVGPLRRLYEDVNHLNRRLHTLEDELRRYNRSIEQERERSWADYKKYPYEKFTMDSTIDEELLKKLSMNVTNKINTGLK